MSTDPRTELRELIANAIDGGLFDDRCPHGARDPDWHFACAACAADAVLAALDLDARDARVRAEAGGLAMRYDPSSSPVDAPAASSEQRGCPETVWDGPYSFVCNKGVTTGMCHQHGRFRDAPSRTTADTDNEEKR